MRVTAHHPTRPAPAAVIDGEAGYELLAAPAPPSRVGVLHVHFAPGARTRWHTHPLGQLLVVTAGSGWVQSRGGLPRALHVGDVVRVEPGEEHWHGAADDVGMSHLAIQERDDERADTALETVAPDDLPRTGEDAA